MRKIAKPRGQAATADSQHRSRPRDAIAQTPPMHTAHHRGLDLSAVPLVRHAPIPANLAVGPSNDRFDQEADRIAAQVMGSHPAIGTAPVAALSPAAPRLQTKSAQPIGDRAAPRIVHEVLNAPGRPLDSATRAFMEPRFGQDFSQVRVHTDRNATRSARAVGALAYTAGTHIAFQTERYQPNTRAGRQLLAHELSHVVQQNGAAGTLMRQEDKANPGPDHDDDHDHDHDHAGKKAAVAAPSQCPEDAALDATYDQWIHYDAKKDALERALLARIDAEIFNPVNKRRNKEVADSYENTMGKKKSFPTGKLSENPSLKTLFYSHSYDWLHLDGKDDAERRKEIKLGKPMGDLNQTGADLPHTMGGPQPPNSLWSYDGSKNEKMDVTFDLESVTTGTVSNDNVKGFKQFGDRSGQKVYVPQLGFPQKPPIDTRQIVCGEMPTIKPGHAKRRGGPTGRSVTGLRLGDLFHRGKRFFSKGTKATVTGAGPMYGWRAGPGKPVQWYTHLRPDDPDKADALDEAMQKKVDAIMAHKLADYKRLEKYYEERSAFIAKYKALLK